MALTLAESGCEVTVIGRKKRGSAPFKPTGYKAKRINLAFEKGIFFYIHLQYRLFWKLYFSKAEVIWANDLDTLLPAYLVAKWRKKQLVYDTHEYFTGVPELAYRPIVRGIWKMLENYIFPKLQNIITVNESLAAKYGNEYNKQIVAIYNMPLKENRWIEPKDNFLLLPASHSETAVYINLVYRLLHQEKRKIIIYQGAINKDRGIEEAIEAMEFVENALLLIIGGGDMYQAIRQKVQKLYYKDKICMLGPIPFEYLYNFTKLAYIGLSIEKPTNINYKLATPNKVFDYIQCHVPVIFSGLVEVIKFNNTYQFGVKIDNHTPEEIAQKINLLLLDTSLYYKLQQNCTYASHYLHWEQQKPKVLQVLNSL
jgi:glycosyltransferase involved in cell wall biosynthesis